MDPYENDSVEDFLAKVKQLEIKAKEEDLRRSERLKDSLASNYSKSSSPYSNEIFIPTPVARSDYSYMTGNITNSNSIQDFNSQISDDYKVDLAGLKYESAYNFERSGNDPYHRSHSTKPLRESHNVNEHYGEGTSERKISDIPEIIRFEDFITKKPYRPSNRYSKFQITDEQKSEIDKTLDKLIGGDNHDNDENEDIPDAQPLTRHQKGGSISQNWTSAATHKPKLSPPIRFSKSSSSSSSSPPAPQLPSRGYEDAEAELNGLRKSPRRMDMSKRSPSKAESILSPTPRASARSPIKKSPAKIDISRLGNDSKSEVNPKSLHFTDSRSEQYRPIPPVRNAWLNSVMQKSTSTTQGLQTNSKTQLDKPIGHSSWLNSAKQTAPSFISQGLPTESKVQLDKSVNQNSWIDSAKKNTPSPHQFIGNPTSKIKIQTNGSNTLTKNLSKFEEMDKKQTSTLEELNSKKLNHVKANRVAKTPEPIKEESAITPVTLKKIRPSRPLKPDRLAREFSNQKLSTTQPSQRKISEEPEALKKSQSLRPAQKVERKVSEEPEAFKKSKSLKPAVPARKPSYKIPEALEKVNNLKHSSGANDHHEDEIPEGLVKLKSLKPSKPLRKPSGKELEALANLKKIKAKNSTGKPREPPAVKSKNARVVSRSNDLLQSQIGRLKSVEKGAEEEQEVKQDEQSPDPEPPMQDPKKTHINNLENLLLRRTITDPNPSSSAASKSSIHDDHKALKKASTFDISKLKSRSESTSMKLDHISKQRTKGPKRRAPKSLK